MRRVTFAWFWWMADLIDKKAFAYTYGWCEGGSFVNRFNKRVYSLVFLKQRVCSRLCGAMPRMMRCDLADTTAMTRWDSGESSTSYPQSIRIWSLDFRKGAERLRAELAESQN